ncbi:MAG TPA: PBP1A family penicillin-binding protein [Gemmatimonadaceae bacterium]|nr:PBP1A family penicillin-binding protein [Gemmatimonadaceae bacterium]
MHLVWALWLVVQPPVSAPWQIIDAPQSSIVIARDGTWIGEFGRQIRTSVSLGSLPAYVPQAFIAVEDRRFYRHDGVDVEGIFGVLKDALKGHARGGSTITMQLVGNMHPDVVSRRDKSVDRKLREQAAAREMERHYSKKQILEAYLNQIELGHGWYGIDAAARHYFGVDAAHLSLSQAATLAALPRSPPYYDPIRHPDRATARRNLVLRLMADQDLITRDAADKARAEALVVNPDVHGLAPYFVDAVRTEAQHAGIPVDSGGYRLYTTLDPSLQRAAITAVRDGAKAVEDRPGYSNPKYGTSKDYLQGLLISLDPTTGEVRALVGGRDYADSPYDRALSALRQPGSAFKPIVYAAAIADSITANTIVYDTALAIPLDDGTTYKPENSDHQFLGPLTMREALTKSRNTVAIQLGLAVGIDTVIALAQRLGITTPIAPFPASAIGASDVRPIELVSAYAPLANGGIAIQPRSILHVDDRAGRLVWAGEGGPTSPALDSNVAYIVRDMMRDVIDRGTAAGVRKIIGTSLPAAGKTGTTNDESDVWFIGMTPDLVTGVWLGFDHPRPIAAGAAGGSLAAPVWGHLMAQYYAGHQPGEWTPPATLITAELDRQTGTLADGSTPPDQRYTEYFLPGTEPLALRFDITSIFSGGPIQ